MAHAGAWSGRLLMVATLNLEGLTIPDGELAPGDWGEGFMDRRHPHTYAHELVLSYVEALRPSISASLSAGKGFAPFGTDDPMSRPIFRYPVNHHLAQILERAVAIGGIRAGPLLAEAGLFNGDEPERPGQWPRISRFGDSWSARLTLLPMSQARAAGFACRGSLPGASTRLRDGSEQVERLCPVGRGGATPPAIRTAGMGPDFGGQGVLRFQERAG